MPIGKDYLKFGENQVIRNNLNENEKIVFTINVMKRNRFGQWQKRDMLLTTELLCNVKNNQFKRNIKINNLRALTRSTDPEIDNFIIHVKDEWDYEFVCKK